MITDEGMDAIRERKQALREEARGRLRALTESQRTECSGSARKLLERHCIWTAAKKILFYAPLDGEVDVWPLLADAIRQGKEAYLPRFVGAGEPARTPDHANPGQFPGTYVICRITDPESEVRTGKYGIREPAESCFQGQLNWLDLTLVPGVAFDLNGCRLGRGKGYYDRLLADVSGTTCGVAFDEQIVESLPTEPHDVRLNCILTPTRWIELQAARGS